VYQQDAYPTIQLPPPRLVFKLLGESPLGQSSPKWEKLLPDSSRTSVRSFTPLSFSPAEKSVTVHTSTQ